ncbi:Chloride channel C-like protein [Theobroma cacao]|uniref:Chloride channel C-like protein n=1 Tax=Theobroma cacao TaxID=3641 RepID=A0A061G7R6_THECC|nr:Chloride channel C-like protein [Theobroma cacao]
MPASFRALIMNIIRYLPHILVVTWFWLLLLSPSTYIAPATASSGIPKVKAYFHGVDAPSILVPITCFAKVAECLTLVDIFYNSYCSNGVRGFIDFCHSGKCGLCGQGGLIMFDVNSTNPNYSVLELVAIIFLWIIGGVLGSLYNYFVDKVLRTYSIINKYV